MVVVMVDANGETAVKRLWFRSTSDTFLKAFHFCMVVDLVMNANQKRWRWVTDEVMKELDITKCGVIIGSALGGMKIFQDAIEALRVSYKKMNPFCVPFATTNMGSAILAMDLGWMGRNYSISTACATSNYCILNAANHIIRGETDMMLSGGSDSAIIPIGLGGFVACNSLSQRNDDPTKASRPWDVSRDGFVMGEGAGVLLLEELEHAKVYLNLHVSIS
ncbi:putative transferase [Helianthus annuus]|nr:putative transferase [Helianthus annuus]